jgi:hypothetical protein
VRIAASLLVVFLLIGCGPFGAAPGSTPTVSVTPPNEPAPTSTPVPTAEGSSGPTLTDTATPDPCTGWWCTVTGVVYTDTVELGNVLQGASVTLEQFSNCSPSRGKQETTTGYSGTFEFDHVFFHDTDRIKIEVEAEGYEPTLWDSKDLYCFYCNCFAPPLELGLDRTPVE